jgi:hypothetical protein
VLEEFAAVQMIDANLPTIDGRELLLLRYTEAEPELKLLTRLRLRPTSHVAPHTKFDTFASSLATQAELVSKLKLDLTARPPPKITLAERVPSPPL